MRKTVLRTASQKDSEGDTENRYLEELVRKKSHQIFKKCMPNAAEEKKLANNLDVQPAPPEIYHEDLTVDKRRHSFHKTLFPKDILYLQVVDIGNPNAYKLQVVAKHGSCSNLQNLHIMMHLPKIPAEMKYFEGGLYKFEYIRGALCSCPAIERKLYVTVDPTIFGGAEAPKLGKVGVEDLPFSTRDPEIGTSLSGCSMNSKVCYKTCIETVAHNIFGIEGSDHFTLFEEWHRKQYTFEETSADFPKTPCVKGSALLCRSIGLYIVGDMKKSYKYANKALSLNPDNVYSHICRGVL
ncbi:uncharacterized protein TNCT_660871 [Trichonephila clavata]|uniref:Uncharacterized protein n=1 Tax=Trichonephila clavata TaxID=2740835 RepID=A0A8X6HG22_TRICU|nr:uncharacterized protein TNCT_660871 [Trichonephila clavata]